MEEVDRQLEQYYSDKEQDEREWVVWYALPWYKRAFARRPRGHKPLFRKSTMNEVLRQDEGEQ